MEKIKAWLSPKSEEISVNGRLINYYDNHRETFLKNLTRIIEMKKNGKDQEHDGDTIITLQNIKKDIQIKYWTLNKVTSIALAYAEMVIEQKDYDKLCEMYSLFKMDNHYIDEYMSIYQSDNFKYNELRRLYMNNRIILY